MAIDGQISTILTSPQLPDQIKIETCEDSRIRFAGSSRSWEGGEWGIQGGSDTEKKKCWEDDVMMFRSWMLFLVAQECRKAEGKQEGDQLRARASKSTGRHA